MQKSVQDMLSDIPKLSKKHLPSLTDRKKYLDTQIKEYKKVIYRFLTDIEADKYFIEIGQAEDKEEFLSTGKQGLASDIGQLRGAAAKLDKLIDLRVELENENSRRTTK